MKRYAIALAAVCLCAAPARAQEDLLRSCAGALPATPGLPAEVVDQYTLLCAQVVSSLAGVQPSVGIAFSGGNPVLGTGTTLGTRLGMVPRVSVTARANVAMVKVPDVFGNAVGRISTGQATLPTLGTQGTPIGAVQGDIAIGLFNGLSLGPTIGGVGSVDLLGSVALLPKISDLGLTQAIRNVGVGARVGILKQGLLVPGVSVSGLYRRMGEVSFGNVDAGDAGEFSTDLETLSVRAVASKGLLTFDFAVGGGYDRYSSDIGIGWLLTCETVQCTGIGGADGLALPGRIDGRLTSAAWNVFGDVALNLLMLNLVAELGYQKATDVLGAEDLQSVGLPDQPLTDEALRGGRLFGSIGLRLNF